MKNDKVKEGIDNTINNMLELLFTTAYICGVRGDIWKKQIGMKEAKKDLDKLYCKKIVGELMKKIKAKPIFIRVGKIDYHMGWCDGRNKLREEIEKILSE